MGPVIMRRQYPRRTGEGQPWPIPPTGALRRRHLVFFHRRIASYNCNRGQGLPARGGVHKDRRGRVLGSRRMLGIAHQASRPELEVHFIADVERDCWRAGIGKVGQAETQPVAESAEGREDAGG